MRKSGPFTLTSIDLVNPASVKLPMGSASAFAALLTTTSMRTEAFHGCCDEGTHIAQRAHMAGDASGVDAQRTQCLLGLRTRVGLSTRNNHASPGMPESFGDRAADPASTPSDQRHPPIKAEEPSHVDTFGIVLTAPSSALPAESIGLSLCPSEFMRVPDRPVGGLQSPRSETSRTALGNQSITRNTSFVERRMESNPDSRWFIWEICILYYLRPWHAARSWTVHSFPRRDQHPSSRVITTKGTDMQGGDVAGV